MANALFPTLRGELARGSTGSWISLSVDGAGDAAGPGDSSWSSLGAGGAGVDGGSLSSPVVDDADGVSGSGSSIYCLQAQPCRLNND